MRKNFRRAITGAALAVGLAVPLAVTTASSASATSNYGCQWPRVCFYLSPGSWNARTPTAAYQDVTSYYQTLGSRSRGAYMVYNSRNDDGALLSFSGGVIACLEPNSLMRGDDLGDGWGIVTMIRIVNPAAC